MEKAPPHPMEPPSRGLHPLLAGPVQFPTSAGPLQIRRLPLQVLVEGASLVEATMYRSWNVRPLLQALALQQWWLPMLVGLTRIPHRVLGWLDSILLDSEGRPVPRGFTANPEHLDLRDLPALAWALSEHLDVQAFVWMLGAAEAGQAKPRGKKGQKDRPGALDAWERALAGVQNRNQWITDEQLRSVVPFARVVQLMRVDEHLSLEELRQAREGDAWISFWIYWGTELAKGSKHMDYAAWRKQIVPGEPPPFERDPKFATLREQADDIVRRTMEKFRGIRFAKVPGTGGDVPLPKGKARNLPKPGPPPPPRPEFKRQRPDPEERARMRGLG